MVANHLWAFSHGVVELFARGRPGGRAPYSAEEMLESGTVIYLRGLGLIPQLRTPARHRRRVRDRRLARRRPS